MKVKDRPTWYELKTEPNGPGLSLFSAPPGSKALSSGLSLHIQEGESLRLVCVPDSNPPATLKWIWGNRTLKPSQPSNHGVLELPQVGLKDHGKYVCQAQNVLGTQTASVNLIVHSELRDTWG
jgi:hypothetical protein